MVVALKALRRLAPADRDEVILPSYTCYSVAASIAKAGLRPRLVDISPETLDFAPAGLADADFGRVLAIIATNLYGLPNDMPTLLRLARERGLFLIDDAAQAMGATIADRPSGTWGDVGLFSFDKGKNISAIDGGAVVTQAREIAGALDEEMAQLTVPALTTSAVHVAKALAYFALLRPWLYWIPIRMPQLELGRTEFTMDFPLAHPDPALMALGVVMMRHLERFAQARRDNAALLLSGLRRISRVSTITARADALPAYVRLPVLLPDRTQRDAAIAALVGDGIGATGSYPECLADVPDLRPLLVNASAAFPGGRAVAQRIVTLPTHPFVTSHDVARVVSLLQRGSTTACAA